MQSGPAEFQIVNAVVWAVLIILFLSLTAIVFLSSRAFELTIGLRIRRERVSTRGMLRAAFFAAGLMMVGLFCLEITSGEPLQTRLAAVGAALIVAWVAVRWSWASMERQVRRRTVETINWRRRADEIDNTLRSLDSPAAIQSYAGTAVASELAIASCQFSPEGPQPARFPVLRVRCRLHEPLLLVLGERIDGQPFSLPQRRFAETVAESVARALDHASHLGAVRELARLSERESTNRDALMKARGFLAPPEKPEVAGLEYAWDRWRGNGVGTTMFDIVALPGRSLGIVLADAEGTSLESVIQLVQVQALLRSRFWAYAEDIRELLESTERALIAARIDRKPIRIFCARYLPETATLRYVNAGFYAPMVLRVQESGAEMIRLASKNPALCEKPSAGLHEDELQLRPADLLAIATQGVAAARGSSYEPWGESRLADTLLSWDQHPVQDIARLTLRTVEEFTGRDAGESDRVLILLRRRAASEDATERAQAAG